MNLVVMGGTVESWVTYNVVSVTGIIKIENDCKFLIRKDNDVTDLDIFQESLLACARIENTLAKI
jgi:hypothetical protein